MTFYLFTKSQYYPADKAAKVYGDTKISNLDFVFVIYLKVKAGVLTIFTMPAFFMYPRPSVTAVIARL